MIIVTATVFPEESVLQKMLAGAHFFDAYRAPLNDAALTPTEIFLRAAKAAPAWVSRLMSLRNTVVRQIGLKDIGAITPAAGKPASDYRIGDRIGIFSVFGSTENELLLGIDDSHLDVRVSVLKQVRGQCYVVSTVVKVHNWIGRVYMMPVGRIHPIVVKALMSRAAV